MNTNKLAFWWVFLTLQLIFTQSCVTSYHDQVVYDPPLAKNIPKIVKGQTTQTEVMQWFGVPHLQADGAEITLYSESPMGLHRAKARETLIKRKKQLQEMEKSGHQRLGWTSSSIDPDMWEKVAKLQPYSSIDDEHIALLYLEMDSKIKNISTIGLPIYASRGSSIYRVNKLLIFINKKTGVVDEFSYWQEFKVD